MSDLNRLSNVWMAVVEKDGPQGELTYPWIGAGMDGLCGIDWCACLHEGEEGKRPHFHIVVMLRDGKRIRGTTLLKDLSEHLGVDGGAIPLHVERIGLRVVYARSSALRYLVHADHPDKMRFPESSVFGDTAGVEAFRHAMSLGEPEVDALFLLELISKGARTLEISRAIGASNYCRLRWLIQDLRKEYAGGLYGEEE